MTKPASPTPQLDALIVRKPDLVDRIFDYLLREGLLRTLEGAGAKRQLAEAQRAVRDQFAAEEAYVARRGRGEREDLARQVLEKFNGRNATEVARELDISRATVYRKLKQSGRDKTVSGFRGNETAGALRSRNGTTT